MPRYAAFLRGVMPTNAKMPELKRCFEVAGFTNVRTLLGSGNVVFDARGTSEPAIERAAEAAMQDQLGRTFMTFARRVDALAALIDSDPYRKAKLTGDAKRVVTFLRAAPNKLALPIEQDGAQILRVIDREAFSAYTRTPKGPVFMTLIKRTFGDDVTTRTWETILKVTA